MELIEVDCTNVDDMLKRLALFGDYWMSRSLLRILGHLWSYLWKSDSETRAVLLYGSEWMVIILNITHEYVKPTCRIEITSMFIGRGLVSSRELPRDEAIAKGFLIDFLALDQDQLDEFAYRQGRPGFFASKEDQLAEFVCPHCSARYRRVSLRHRSDGSVLCPNCDFWILPPPRRQEEQKAE